MITIKDIAKACHEANKALCESIGDATQKHWEYAAPWQKYSAIAGVEWRLDNPAEPNSAQHEAWMESKAKDGWKYGAVKDAAAKTHPCMVPYAELPEEQKAKDALFVGIVMSLRGLLD